MVPIYIYSNRRGSISGLHMHKHDYGWRPNHAIEWIKHLICQLKANDLNMKLNWLSMSRYTRSVSKRDFYPNIHGDW
jgi:hypothetical protein